MCVLVPVLRGQMVECDAYEPVAGLENSPGFDWQTNWAEARRLAIDNARSSASAQGLEIMNSRYDQGGADVITCKIWIEFTVRFNDVAEGPAALVACTNVCLCVICVAGGMGWLRYASVTPMCLVCGLH